MKRTMNIFKRMETELSYIFIPDRLVHTMKINKISIYNGQFLFTRSFKIMQVFLNKFE